MVTVNENKQCLHQLILLGEHNYHFIDINEHIILSVLFLLSIENKQDSKI